MKSLSLLLSLCGCLMVPLSSMAGDAATLNFLGFSEDGQHVAFEQFGVTDGSAAPYAELHMIDVEKNAYLLTPIKQYPSPDSSVAQMENADEAIETLRQANRRTAHKPLDQFALREAQAGYWLVSRPLTDLGADPFNVRFTPHLALSGHAYDEFILQLQETALDDKDCEGLGKAKIFSLTVRRRGTPLARAVQLQTDTQLPSSRGCPLGYRIAHVYAYQEKYLAVFLNMFVPGYEGQNMRYLVVTGLLPERGEEGEQMSDEALDKREDRFQQAVDALEQKKLQAQPVEATVVPTVPTTPETTTP